MADVGRNAVIGAGAVVTSPIPDNVVAAGVPARVIRDRS
jgi:acetyltransferase-like isoleucine patch superfamily enzyme